MSVDTNAITELYAYHTGERGDGFTVCVGAHMANATPSVDGAHALFKTPKDAVLYMNAYAETHAGVRVIVLPSVQAML